MMKSKQSANPLASEIQAVSNEYSSPVRVFMVSDSEDFLLERNYIFEKIYTSIKSKYDDITFIDKHAFSVQSRHKSRPDDGIKEFDFVHSSELLNSFFIILIGDKHGSKQFKPIISKEEFDTILGLTEHIELSYQSTVDNLLRSFYEFDDNYIGNKFYKLRDFDSVKAKLGLTHNDEQLKWKVLKQQILDLMCEAADICFQNGDLNEEERSKYFITDFEEDISRAILKNPLASKNVFVIFRNYGKQQAEKLKTLDNEDNENNVENTLMMDIIKQKIFEIVPVDRQYYLEFESNNKSNKQTIDSDGIRDYLIKLENILMESFDKIFLDRLNAITNTNDMAYYHAKELLHHERYCNRILKEFLPRDEYLNKLREYVTDRENSYPFLIDGEIGAGKTCMMASFAKNLKYDSDFNILVYRFVGTSHQSSNLITLFQSIVYELEKKLNISIDTMDKVTGSCLSIVSLREKLLNILRKSFERNSVKKHYILIDGVDILCQQDPNFNFLITNLPKNTKIVYSVNTETICLNDSIKLAITNSYKNYFKIKPYDLDTAKDVLWNWTFKFNRRLRDNQMAEIQNCYEKAQSVQPFHLRLLYSECLNWSSSFKPDIEFRYCLNSKDTIRFVFEKLEKAFGKVLFARLVFYLAIFKSGISESELDDLLTIDDSVMYEIMCNYDSLFKRFPMYLWIHIKYELKDFFIENEFDNTILISWNHRLFAETAEKTYPDIFKAGEQRDTILMNIIEYFKGTWNDKPKKYTLKTKSNEINLNDLNLTSLRCTKSQEIQNEYFISNKSVKSYNNRKLNELLGVILMLTDPAKKIVQLKELIYLHYEFMYAKCELKTLHFIFDTHKELVDLVKIVEKKQLAANVLNAARELVSISDLYVKNFDKLQANADSLGLCIASNGMHEDLFCDFEYESLKNCALMSIQQYQPMKTNQYVKTLFQTDIGSLNHVFYNDLDFNVIFVLNEIDKSTCCTLNVVNIINGQQLGLLDMDKCQFYNPFLLRKTTLNLTTSKKLQGGVIYENDRTIYKLTFDEKLFKYRQFDSPIKYMRLISTAHLLIQFKNSVYIYHLEQNRVLHRHEFKQDIKFVSLNQEKTTIYLPDLDYMDTVLIVVDVKNQISIFNFVKNTQTFKQLVELQIDHNIDQCLIDKTFFVENLSTFNQMHNFKDMTVFVRFALWDDTDCLLQIINVYKDFEYDVITTEFEKNGFLLNDFIDKSIVITSNDANFVFDIEKSKMFEACYSMNGTIGAYQKCLHHGKTKLLALSKNTVELHEINQYEANDKMIKTAMLMKIDFMACDLIVKGDKSVLALSHDRKRLVKFNPLHVPFEVSNISHVIVSSILANIDDDHILVHIKPKNPYYNGEIGILHIMSQTFKARLNLKNYFVFASNSKYLILSNESSILIFNLKKEADKGIFVFKKLKQIQLDFLMSADDTSLNRCFFNDNAQAVITLYNKPSDILNIFKLVYNDTTMQTAQYDQRQIELDLFKFKTRDIACLVTSLSNYIVLTNGVLLYCIDIEASAVLTEMQLNLSLYSLTSIKSTNDCLAFYHDFQNNQTKFMYIQIEVNQAYCDFKITEKLYDSIIDDMKLNGSYLFIKTNEKGVMLDVYDLGQLKVSKKFRAEQLVFQDDILDTCMSTDQKYIGVCCSKSIHVYRLDGLKRIARLDTDNVILNCFLNDKYLTVLMDNEHMVSYFIVDVNNKIHLDRVEQFEIERKIFNESSKSILIKPEYLKIESFNTDLFNFDQIAKQPNFDELLRDEYVQLLKYLFEKTRETYFIGEEQPSVYSSFDASSVVGDSDNDNLDCSMMSMCADPGETNEIADDVHKAHSLRMLNQLDSSTTVGPSDQSETEKRDTAYSAADDNDDEDDPMNRTFVIEDVLEDEHPTLTDEQQQQIEPTGLNKPSPIDVNENEKQIEQLDSEPNTKEVLNRIEEEEHCAYDVLSEVNLVEQVDYYVVDELPSRDASHAESIGQTQIESANQAKLETVDQIEPNDQWDDTMNDEIKSEELMSSSSNDEDHEQNVSANQTFDVDEVETVEQDLNDGKHDEQLDDHKKVELMQTIAECHEIGDKLRKPSDNESLVNSTESINYSLMDDSRNLIIDENDENDNHNDINNSVSQNDNDNDIELPDYLTRSSDTDIYWSYDSSCIILSSRNPSTNESQIFLINTRSNNFNMINVISLPANTKKTVIQPCIHGILCISDTHKLLYKIDFDGTTHELKQYQEQINDIQLLSTTHMLVQFENKIEIFDFFKNESLEKTYAGSGIKRILTTIPKYTIYSPEFDLVDTYVLLVFADNSIKVLKFLKDTHVFMLITEINIFDNIDDCLLDASYLVDQILNSNQLYSIQNSVNLLRFAVWNRDKCLARVLNVSKNFNSVLVDSNVIQFDRCLFVRKRESSLVDFFRDTMLLGADGGTYLLDIENRTLVDMTKMLSTMHYSTKLIEGGKLITQRYDQIEIHALCQLDKDAKFLKTVILLSLNIEIKNLKLNAKTSINRPGDGCRITKLNHFLNQFKRSSQITNKNDDSSQIIRIMKKERFNKDLFGFDRYHLEIINCKPDYVDLLESYQDDIQKLPVIQSFESK